jgi:hypothetical protein
VWRESLFLSCSNWWRDPVKHGHFLWLVWVRPGQKKAPCKKWWPKPILAQLSGQNSQPRPCRGGYFLLGSRAIGPSLPKILSFPCPDPAQLGYRAKICSLGLARLHVLARRVGPISGRVGQAGLPMLRLGPSIQLFGYGNIVEWLPNFTLIPNHAMCQI